MFTGKQPITSCIRFEASYSVSRLAIRIEQNVGGRSDGRFYALGKTSWEG